MTDEQIEKDLERVQSHGKSTAYNAFTAVTNALSLIRRQKAEIDRLTAERDDARRDCAISERNHALAVEERVANVIGFTEQLATARSDAEYWQGETQTARSEIDDAVSKARADSVRNFAERVLDLFPSDRVCTTISRATIERFVREMTEGEG